MADSSMGAARAPLGTQAALVLWVALSCLLCGVLFLAGSFLSSGSWTTPAPGAPVPAVAAVASEGKPSLRAVPTAASQITTQAIFTVAPLLSAPTEAAVAAQPAGAVEAEPLDSAGSSALKETQQPAGADPVPPEPQMAAARMLEPAPPAAASPAAAQNTARIVQPQPQLLMESPVRQAPPAAPVVRQRVESQPPVAQPAVAQPPVAPAPPQPTAPKGSFVPPAQGAQGAQGTQGGQTMAQPTPAKSTFVPPSR